MNMSMDVEGLIEKIITKNRLGIDNRIGLLILSDKNIGDIYFMIASLTYAQKMRGRKYVIISPEEFSVQVFAKWHKRYGADIETFFVNIEEWRSLVGYLRNTDSYSGVLDLYDNEYDVVFLRNNTLRKDVYENLTRPVFPFFDRKKYVEKYKVIPGKTVFVIPQAVFHGSLPIYFWKMSINLFKLLGYQVLVNEKEGSSRYGDVQCCLPPLDDVVALCNLCGTVYSVRTGLVELIASETNAKLYIFGVKAPSPGTAMSVFHSVLEVYPHIDNTDNHVVEVEIPFNKEEFFWIKEIAEQKHSLMDFMRRNIYERDKEVKIEGNLDEYITPSCRFYSSRFTELKFVDFPHARIPDFCQVKYKLSLDRERIKLSLLINPSIYYKIHVALKTVGSKTIVESCEDYNYPVVYFVPEDDGDYYISVQIVHPFTGDNCWFETESVLLQHSLEFKMRHCEVYSKYISMLYKYRKSLVVFITSKDAHIDFMNSRDLEMEQFQIKTDLQHTFRHSWLCVIDGGNLIKELSSKDQQVTAEYEWDGNSSLLTSAGYNVNKSDKTPVSIKINDEEFCVNLRGLNFVVWDKEKNCILDSVCFDTFLDGKVYRKILSVSENGCIVPR